jgi:hypothetical protein
MKIKNWNQFNENVKKSAIEVAEEYNKKYNTNWFSDFLEVFEKEEWFKNRYDDYREEPDDVEEWMEISEDPELSDEEKEEIWDEMTWSAESEVNMLENEVGVDYPGDEAWVDFHEDLAGTDWVQK